MRISPSLRAGGEMVLNGAKPGAEFVKDALRRWLAQAEPAYYEYREKAPSAIDIIEPLAADIRFARAVVGWGETHN